MLASPDREIELDLLSDPSIKSQLEIGFNIDYKIPATNIRTMPIEIEEEFKVKVAFHFFVSANFLGCFLTLAIIVWVTGICFYAKSKILEDIFLQFRFQDGETSIFINNNLIFTPLEA